MGVAANTSTPFSFTRRDTLRPTSPFNQDCPPHPSFQSTLLWRLSNYKEQPDSWMSLSTRRIGPRVAPISQCVALSQSPNLPHRTRFQHESPNVSSQSFSYYRLDICTRPPTAARDRNEIPRPRSSTCTRCKEREAVEIQRRRVIVRALAFIARMSVCIGSE